MVADRRPKDSACPRYLDLCTRCRFHRLLLLHHHHHLVRLMSGWDLSSLPLVLPLRGEKLSTSGRRRQ